MGCLYSSLFEKEYTLMNWEVDDMIRVDREARLIDESFRKMGVFDNTQKSAPIDIR